MSTPKSSPRPTIDVNKNGIQTRFNFKVEEPSTKKALKKIKKKKKHSITQLRLLSPTIF